MGTFKRRTKGHYGQLRGNKMREFTDTLEKILSAAAGFIKSTCGVRDQN